MLYQIYVHYFDLLIKIEELGFTDLLRVDLPELNNSALNDCFKIDLQNDYLKNTVYIYLKLK